MDFLRCNMLVLLFLYRISEVHQESYSILYHCRVGNYIQHNVLDRVIDLLLVKHSLVAINLESLSFSFSLHSVQNPDRY